MLSHTLQGFYLAHGALTSLLFAVAALGFIVSQQGSNLLSSVIADITGMENYIFGFVLIVDTLYEISRFLAAVSQLAVGIQSGEVAVSRIIYLGDNVGSSNMPPICWNGKSRN